VNKVDSSAIEKIQESQAIERANIAISNLLAEGANGVVALPSDFKLEALERFQLGRYRFRGAMTTPIISAFAAYVVNHCKEESACFIEEKTMSAKLIFNIGNQGSPGHCDHYAQLSLQKTAAYKALEKIIDRSNPQQDVAEFIEDWRELIVCLGEANSDGERQPIGNPMALHAIRNFKIEEKRTTTSNERDFGASRGSLEEIDVASQQIPPARILFSCAPYHGLSERVFELRLSVLKQATPAIVLRIVKQEEHNEKMLEEFKEIVAGNLGDINPAPSVYVGNFSAQDR
jgi:uncharacterized protein YfdQ (DUF2303 family)